MGFPNLEREEAKTMRRRNGRSLILAGLAFVFVCLLLSGGSRLIGHSGDVETVPCRPVPSIEAMLTGVQDRNLQTGCVCRKEHSAQRFAVVSAREDQPRMCRILSDANGNVLSSDSYMHAVYQVFALGDGFV